MANNNVVILAAVAIVAAAGAAAYVVTSQHPPPAPAPATAPATVPAAAPPATPSAMVAPPPAPAPAAPPSLPDASASGTASQPFVATVEFSADIQKYTLVRDSAAYVSASPDAPQMYPLRAGTGLISAERSKDGKWIVALTQDGQAAYLMTADLGPYDPSKQPEPELASTLSGDARVVDTATLTVAGQTISLAGVSGKSGDYADQLQALVNAQGPAVTCQLLGQAYQCKLPTGMDIARAALFNGAAEPNSAASDDYRAQAEAAKAAHRGIWK
jgi:endonuclease YncB( thermonuclease family)